MLNAPTDPEASERREESRLTLSALACVELGEGNGGIIINLSEGGVALSSALKLPAEPSTRLRIQVPKSRDWIDVNGQIRWANAARKKAGYQFLDLSEFDRRRISDWILRESAARESDASTTVPAKIPQRELRPLSLTGFVPAPTAPAEAAEIRIVDDTTSTIPVSVTPPVELSLAQPLPLQAETDSTDTATSDPSEEPVSTADQRLYERQPVKAMAFLELGECNGGVILDISEGGVSVRTGIPVTDQNQQRIRFQLPPGRQWIEASGRVVRLDESKTRAGIEFMNLSSETSMRISEWIASQSARAESPVKVSEIYEKTAQLLESLTAAESQKVIPQPPPETVLQPVPVLAAREQIILPAPHPPVLVPPKAPVTVRSSVPAIVPAAPASVAQPAKKPTLELSARPAAVRAIPAATRPTWMTLALSVGLAALLSFALAWIVAERAARDQVLRMLGNALPGKIQSAVSNQPAPPVSKSSTSARSVTPAPQQTKSATPPAAATVATARQTPPPLAASAAQGAPASPNLKSPPASAPPQTPSPKAPATLSALRAPSVSPRTATESKPPQIRGQEPAASKTLAAVIPPPPPAQVASAQPAPAKESASATATPLSTQQAATSQPITEAKQLSAPPAKPPEPVETAKGAVSVSFSPFPSLRIPPELKSQPAKSGTSLQIGQLLSRVDPVYPEDAERQRIEGTVKLHVVIGREGAVQSVTVLNGSPALAPAAESALRQWRYKQTLFAGQAIEAEQDVTVVFRIVKLRQ